MQDFAGGHIGGALNITSDGFDDDDDVDSIITSAPPWRAPACFCATWCGSVQLCPRECLACPEEGPSAGAWIGANHFIPPRRLETIYTRFEHRSIPSRLAYPCSYQLQEGASC